MEARRIDSLNGALKEIREASSGAVSRISEKAGQAAKQAATGVDRAARRNPWYFVGASAAAAAVLGFVAGRKWRS